MSRKSNFEIAFQLGANMDPSVKKAFGDTQKRLGNFRKGLGNAAKAAGKMALGVAGAFTAVAGSGLAVANSAAKAGDRIDKMSQRLGMSRSSFQEWDFILSQSGSSIESMEQGMKTLTQRMQDSANGTGKGAEAFERLGVSVHDSNGEMKDQEEIFEESIRALQGMEEGAEKSALANDLFGRSGQELLPLLNGQRGSLDELKDKYEELGIEMSDEAVDAGVMFTDTMDQLRRTLGFLTATVGSKVLPIFQNLLDGVMERMPAIQERINRAIDRGTAIISWIGETGMRVFNSIKDAIEDNFEPTMSLRERVERFGEILQNAWQFAQPYIEWFINEGIPKAVEMMANAIERAKEVYHWIAERWEFIGPVVYGVVGAMAAYVAITKIVAAVVAIKTAAVAGFGAVMAFITSPIGLVILAIGAMIAIGILLYRNWDTISAKAMEIWGGIRDYFSGVASKIGDSVSNLREGFVNAFQRMRDGIKGPVNAIGAMGNSLIGGFERIVNGASNAINKIPSIDIPSWVPPPFGGKSFGIPNIPNVSLGRIPQLAQGGITTGATLAMIGEGAEQEAVLPLSKLDQFVNGEGKGGNTTNTNNEESNVYHFHNKKEVHVYGNADKKDVEDAIEESDRKFEKRIQRYLKNRKRLQFN